MIKEQTETQALKTGLESCSAIRLEIEERRVKENLSKTCDTADYDIRFWEYYYEDNGSTGTQCLHGNRIRRLFFAEQQEEKDKNMKQFRP